MRDRSLVDEAAKFYFARRGFESYRSHHMASPARSNTGRGQARPRRETGHSVREQCEAKAAAVRDKLDVARVEASAMARCPDA